MVFFAASHLKKIEAVFLIISSNSYIATVLLIILQEVINSVLNFKFKS